MDEAALKNLDPEDKIALLVNDLPTPIKRFVLSKERDEVSLELTQRYNLHADVAGAFDQAYIFMLLGIYSPDEFVTQLRDAGLTPDIVRSLTSDVNEMVFKKLREEEQEGSSFTAPRSHEQPSRDELRATIEVLPTETTVKQLVATETPQYSQPLPPQLTAPPHPRTMQQDMQYVQQGNLHDAELGVMQPYQQTFAPATQAPAPTPPTYAAQPQTLASTPYVPPAPPPAWHASAAASFQTASIPNTAPSQLNPQRYVAPPTNNMPSQMTGVFQPPAREAMPPLQPQSFAPLKKEYGADPYREMPQ